VHAHAQRLVSSVKIATVLEEYTTKDQNSVGKGFNANDMHKEIFSVYGGKCLSRKEVHNWFEKFSQGCLKVTDDETEVQNWLRWQSKDFSAAGFDTLVKRWDTCINVGGGYVRFEYHMFYILYSFVTYLLTLLHIIGQLVDDIPSGLSLTPSHKIERKTLIPWKGFLSYVSLLYKCRTE
jgi:hypothetical protein